MVIDPLKAQRILINLICIFLLAFSYTKIVKNKRFRFPLINVFIIANICALLCDTIGTFLMGHTEIRSDMLLYLFENGYNCGAIIATGCWFLNSIQIVDESLFAKKPLLGLIMLPLAIDILLTLTTGIHRKIFYIDEAFQYVRGDWFIGFFSVAGIYILLATFLYLYAELNKEKYIFKGLNRISFLYSAALFLCMGLQLIFRMTLPIINAAAAIVTLMIHEDLQDKAITLDALTNLNNRNAINNRLLNILKHSRQHCLAVLLDVDDFKKINDKNGHLEGDKALINIGDALRKVFGETAFYGRLAGDEFVILIESDVAGDIGSIEERINNALREISREQEKSYSLSVTAGIALIDENMHTIPDVLSLVDERLYANKRLKKGLAK